MVRNNYDHPNRRRRYQQVTSDAETQAAAMAESRTTAMERQQDALIKALQEQLAGQQQQLSAQADITRQLSASANQALAAVAAYEMLTPQLLNAQASQFGQQLQEQQQAFLEALTLQKADIHAELLGQYAPLLTAIEQLRAMDVSEEAVHVRLFNQLTDHLQRLSTLETYVPQLATSLDNTKATLTLLQTNYSATAATVTNLNSVLVPGLQSQATSNKQAIEAQKLRIDDVLLQLAGYLKRDQVRTKLTPVPNLALNLVGQVSVVFETPFPDDGYIVAHGVQASGIGILEVASITAKTKAGYTANVKNIGLSATAGTLHSIAIRL